MNYLVLGMNHRTAPVETRERFSLVPEAIPLFLRKILAVPGIVESTVLSTCNRFELYTVMEPEVSWREALRDVFPVARDEKQHGLYERGGRDVVSHLFAVTSSLDSMVVGENQIAGQVKQAFYLAMHENATGPFLNRLFPRALHVAKRVKTETGLGKQQVSVGSVAVNLAKKIFGDLSKRSVVLLGAGKVGELVWRHLSKNCAPENVFVVNRSQERARDLVLDGNAQVATLEDLDDILVGADILITSVSYQLTNKNREYFSKLMVRRGHRPLFVIDLGMPRNILPEVTHVPDVYLYNIDDLKSVAGQNLGFRQSEMQRAHGIITEETDLFFAGQPDHQILPAIAGLNQKFEEIRRREVEKSLGKLSHLSESDRLAIEKLTKAIVNKALHDPILVLRTKKELSEGPFLSVFKKLFRLGEEENEYQ